MDDKKLFFYEHPRGIVFKAFIQPRSSKNMIVGLHGDALKIKLTAPPVDNAANRLCTKFLAKYLNISDSRIEVVAGHTSRTKQILIHASRSKITRDEARCLRDLVQRLVHTVK